MVQKQGKRLEVECGGRTEYFRVDKHNISAARILQDAIRTAFDTPPYADLSLRDEDGCVISLQDAISFEVERLVCTVPKCQWMHVQVGFSTPDEGPGLIRVSARASDKLDDICASVSRQLGRTRRPAQAALWHWFQAGLFVSCMARDAGI